ncbi:hypothetical protein JHK82_056035 [Glycine max]|uniref:Uncharacterized protein n=1 Tax=Glycine max TaxID=3847 RepID=A0A0R0EA21_SOYBN|nr:hypothetical protein JHK82_056035 [Glycine max]
MMIRVMWPKSKKSCFNNIIMIMIGLDKQGLLQRYVGVEEGRGSQSRIRLFELLPSDLDKRSCDDANLEVRAADSVSLKHLLDLSNKGMQILRILRCTALILLSLFF